jgi:hypothetical protein
MGLMFGIIGNMPGIIGNIFGVIWNMFGVIWNIFGVVMGNMFGNVVGNMFGKVVGKVCGVKIGDTFGKNVGDVNVVMETLQGTNSCWPAKIRFGLLMRFIAIIVRMETPNRTAMRNMSSPARTMTTQLEFDATAGAWG